MKVSQKDEYLTHSSGDSTVPPPPNKKSGSNLAEGPKSNTWFSQGYDQEHSPSSGKRNHIPRIAWLVCTETLRVTYCIQYQTG